MNDLKRVFERSYEKIMLTYYLLSIVAFYTHLKISEHGWFSDGIKRKHWEVIGWKYNV